MTRRYTDLRHARPSRGPVDWILLCATAAALFVIAIMVIIWSATMRPAHARWSPAYADADPKIQTWFSHQNNGKGEWCCDKSDGHPFYGDYKINDDGSVTLDGTTLPAYMVLKGPNPTGHAVWWFTGSGENHRDYCFAPGTLS